MKRNGFTLIEMLAVFCIMGLLIILGVPAYLGVYTATRRNNYQGKIKEIEIAAEKYGSARKDEIKKYYDENKSCVDTSISYLIEQGYLTSESKTNNYIINPTTMSPMNGKIFLCYDYNSYDVKSYYAVKFEKDGVYAQGERVYQEYGNELRIYETMISFEGGTLCKEKSGIVDKPMGLDISNGLDKLQNCATKRQGTEIISTPQNFFKLLTI